MMKFAREFTDVEICLKQLQYFIELKPDDYPDED